MRYTYLQLQLGSPAKYMFCVAWPSGMAFGHVLDLQAEVLNTFTRPYRSTHCSPVRRDTRRCSGESAGSTGR